MLKHRKAIVTRDGFLENKVVDVIELMEDDPYFEGYYRCVLHGQDTNYAVYKTDLQFVEEVKEES